MNIIEKTFPIREVTIYPDSARIRRIQQIALKKGRNELVIKGLPDNITEESVRIEIENSNQLKILDILSRDVFIEQHNENKYKIVRKNVENLVLKRKKIEAGFRNYIDEFLLFLNKEKLTCLEPDELQKTIAVKNWEEFFLFVRKKLTENRNSSRDVLFGWIDVQREIEAAMRKLEEFESYDKYKEHHIIARIEAAQELNRELHVMYLQPGVSWHPAYTLRADLHKNILSINLFGMISQTTGEDWSDIKVILSTAIPMHNCNIPEVNSKRIRERDTSIIMTDQPSTGGIMSEKPLDIDEDVTTDGLFKAEMERSDKKKIKRKEKRDRRSKASSVNMTIAGKKGFTAAGMATKLVKTSEEKEQCDEKPSPKAKKLFVSGGLHNIDTLVQGVDNKILPPFSLGTLSGYYRALYSHLGDSYIPEDSLPQEKKIKTNTFFTKGVSLVQSVGGFDYRYTVASIQKEVPSSSIPVQVSVDIKELPLELVYITVPLEKELVYLKAVFSNEYDNPFPAGPAKVFVENNFLGNINFPTLGINQGTFISLGIERDIKVLRKEKVIRKTGGMVKKGVTEHYAIEIELMSYKAEPVYIEVLDRVPISSQKTDIEVYSPEFNPQPKRVTERSIILWKIKLLPKKKKVLSFSYSIKHPENMRLTMRKGTHPYLDSVAQDKEEITGK